MNHIKALLLTLALISSPLIAMDQELPQRISFCTKIKTGLCLFLLASQPAAGSTYRDFYRRYEFSDSPLRKSQILEATSLMNQLSIKSHDNFNEFAKAWDEIRIVQDVAADCGDKEMLRKTLIAKDKFIRLNKKG